MVVVGYIMSVSMISIHRTDNFIMRMAVISDLSLMVDSNRC